MEYSTNPGLQVFSVLGALLAVFLSAAVNHSFWWGVLHFFLGWFYVIYFLIFRTGLLAAMGVQ